MSELAGTFVPRAAALSNSLVLIGKLVINPFHYIPIRRTHREAENRRVSPSRSRNIGLKVGLAKAENSN